MGRELPVSILHMRDSSCSSKVIRVQSKTSNSSSNENNSFCSLLSSKSPVAATMSTDPLVSHLVLWQLEWDPVRPHCLQKWVPPVPPSLQLWHHLVQLLTHPRGSGGELDLPFILVNNSTGHSNSVPPRVTGLQDPSLPCNATRGFDHHFHFTIGW